MTRRLFRTAALRSAVKHRYRGADGGRGQTLLVLKAAQDRMDVIPRDTRQGKIADSLQDWSQVASVSSVTVEERRRRLLPIPRSRSAIQDRRTVAASAGLRRRRLFGGAALGTLLLKEVLGLGLAPDNLQPPDAKHVPDSRLPTSSRA